MTATQTKKKPFRTLQEEYKLVNAVYAPGKGNFCFNLSNAWFTCREEFHTSHQSADNDKRHRVMYFGTPDPPAVARLIRWVEYKLNLRYKFRTKVWPCKAITDSNLVTSTINKVLSKENTSKKKVNSVYIELSDFWLEKKIRCMFLSAVLRCAHDTRWTKPWSNALKVLMSSKYLSKTPRALAQFLSGHVDINIVNGGGGWVNEFSLPKGTTRMQRPVSESTLSYFRGNASVCNLTTAEAKELETWVELMEDTLRAAELKNVLPFPYRIPQTPKGKKNA